MLKIRRYLDRLIFNMGILIPRKDGLYIEMGPRFPWLSLILYHIGGHVDVIQKEKRNLIVLWMLISSVSPVYIQNENLVITVPADVLAPHGARPPAGRIMTVQLHMFSMAFLGL